MGKTITGIIQTSYGLEISKEFLRHAGIWDWAKDGAPIYIEMKEYPKILDELEKTGLFEGQDHWEIHSISRAGITLLLKHPTEGEGYCFLSRSNIITLHSLGDAWLKT